jgi:hypothetical protein
MKIRVFKYIFIVVFFLCGEKTTAQEYMLNYEGYSIHYNTKHNPEAVTINFSISYLRDTTIFIYLTKAQYENFIYTKDLGEPRFPLRHTVKWTAYTDINDSVQSKNFEPPWHSIKKLKKYKFKLKAGEQIYFQKSIGKFSTIINRCTTTESSHRSSYVKEIVVHFLNDYDCNKQQYTDSVQSRINYHVPIPQRH